MFPWGWGGWLRSVALMRASLGTNSGHIFFKSLCVTLLIHFLFWLLKSWFGRKRKLPHILPKSNAPQSHVISPRTLGRPSLSTSLKGNSAPLPTRNSAWPCVWDAWAEGSEQQEATRADLCQGLRTVPGREPLTAPSPHWRCTNEQQISNEYLFASKLAKVLAQPGTSNRYVRIFHVLLTDK